MSCFNEKDCEALIAGAGATAFANPSGLIDLVAHNGVAATAERSDSRHALDQSIAPTWTGDHKYSKASIGFLQNWITENTSPAAGILQGQYLICRLADNGAVLHDAYVVEIGRSVDWTANLNVTSKVSFNAIVANTIRQFLTTENRNVILTEIGFTLAAAATDGFVFIPKVNGVPVGIPTTYAGKNPLCYNEGDQKLYIYDFTANAWVTWGSPAFGNPTALVGLVAVNGVAATAMRSDGAPAIDQTIAPTWSGIHSFDNVSKFQIGTSGQYCMTEGCLTPVIGPVATTGTGALEVLLSLTIPANGFTILNSGFKFRFSGITAFTPGNPKKIGIQLGTGAQALTITLGNFSVDAWIMEGVLVKIAGNNFAWNATFLSGQGFSPVPVSINSVSNNGFAVLASSANTIDLIAQGAVGDVTADLGTGSYFRPS